MFTIAALYRFADFSDPAALRPALLEICQANDVRGTLILAGEGINGTIAGPAEGIAQVVDHIRGLPGCAGLMPKYATADEPPFERLKIRLKAEIVTMGSGDLRPSQMAGTYVPPGEWNALISDPDTVVIDTRNDYEVAIGTFRGAIDPETASFRDFPAWWAANADRFQGKRVAMFCTGGIRCEKSTAFVKRSGHDEVYHLEGGILRYLEEMPADQSAWDGACFVFDRRVSVLHGLEEGPHDLCYGCRRPILPADRAHPDFEEGVSCPQCAQTTSEADKDRFRERQRQLDLAKSRQSVE